jgi:hypothetical protein
MKGYIWWWQVEGAKTFDGWWSCEARKFIQAYLHYYSHCIILCLLFIVGDFLLFVIFHEGICDGRMLVLLYVFIGLYFMRQILNLWVCDVCQKQFMMWKLPRCNEENLREASCWNMRGFFKKNFGKPNTFLLNI